MPGRFSAILPLSAVLAAALCLSCSTGKGPKHGYLCRDHGYHRATIKDEFAACFQIKAEEIDSFYIFQQEASCNGKNAESEAAKLKGIIADQIVEMIMSRLEAAYGKELTSRWRLESIDISVPFRSFVLSENGSCRMKVIAILRKDDLSPRSLTKFLPLEYKMNILEPTEREKQDFRMKK